MPINVQAKGVREMLQVNELRIDAVEYFDPDRGYLMASYQVHTTGFVSGRQSGVLRSSCRTTLDPKESRGIEAAKGGS